MQIETAFGWIIYEAFCFLLLFIYPAFEVGATQDLFRDTEAEHCMLCCARIVPFEIGAISPVTPHRPPPRPRWRPGEEGL